MFNPEQSFPMPDGPHFDQRPEAPDVLAAEKKESKKIASGDTVSAMTPQGIDHECLVEEIKDGVCLVRDSYGVSMKMDAEILSAYQDMPEVAGSRRDWQAKRLVAAGREIKIKQGDKTTSYRIRDVLRGGGNNLVLEEIGPDGQVKSTASSSQEEVMSNLVEATPSPDARYQAGDTVMIHGASLGKPVAWEVVGPAGDSKYDYHVKRRQDNGQELGKDVTAREIMGAI